MKHLKFTRPARRRAQAKYRAAGIAHQTGLSDKAKMIYLVGLLVVDEGGLVRRELVSAAWSEPQVRTWAASVCKVQL